MSTRVQRISPCLWFDDQAEPAAQFYTSVFQNSRVIGLTHYGTEGFEIHGRPAGSVMTVDFELDGLRFTALNGGPLFKFTAAISLVVHCEDQSEIDFYWEALSAGGDPKSQQCGWLKDRYGLSWQITWSKWAQYLNHPDAAKSARAMRAILEMKKPDLRAIERAFAGG
jgi:predicted 3-demethylubiquinone-9 3-methyltransferase (glyoxalase superfamily)